MRNTSQRQHAYTVAHSYSAISFLFFTSKVTRIAQEDNSIETEFDWQVNNGLILNYEPIFEENMLESWQKWHSFFPRSHCRSFPIFPVHPAMKSSSTPVNGEAQSPPKFNDD